MKTGPTTSKSRRPVKLSLVPQEGNRKEAKRAQGKNEVSVHEVEDSQIEVSTRVMKNCIPQKAKEYYKIGSRSAKIIR